MDALSSRRHGASGLAAMLILAACATSPDTRSPGPVSTKVVAASSKAGVLPPAPQSPKTLYERLGGYDAISAVVDAFAQKLFDDPIVGKRFFGMSADSRANFRQMNKNLVCNVTGGPCKVISRPAKVAHGGLGIKASEFDIVVGHLVSTLDQFKVPRAEKEELLAIIGALRPDIVEVEKQ